MCVIEHKWSAEETADYRHANTHCLGGCSVAARSWSEGELMYISDEVTDEKEEEEVITSKHFMLNESPYMVTFKLQSVRN